MKVEDFVNIIGSDFYTGVPDSQLRPLCDYLYNTFEIDGKHHIIAANEGNAVGIAAGYHLATGKVPVVYMQNSGEGNAINPMASLLNEKIYAIPVIFIIGWRGEPGVHDEPQHVFQGEITTKLLDLMGVEWMIVGVETTEDELEKQMQEYKKKLYDGHSVAFVIRKCALSYDQKVEYKSHNGVVREEAIEHIVEAAGDDLIVCTTGKASRELFEIRERRHEGHDRDFLTVGSMGHASSIALGIALNTEKRVWCVDGDGAMLMHLGAMGTISKLKPENFVHVVLNNGAHESVGGMPTVADMFKSGELKNIARIIGYEASYCEDTLGALDIRLEEIIESRKLSFIEIKCLLDSRSDLGRPTTIPIKNKEAYMKWFKKAEVI